MRSPGQAMGFNSRAIFCAAPASSKVTGPWVAVGTMATGRSPATCSRSAIRVWRCPQFLAALQPLSTTSTRGPSPRIFAARPSSGSARARISKCRRQKPQQQQPPGRVRRRLLFVLQSQKQTQRRKQDAARLGRRDLQQPPQDRQHGQRRQNPGGAETQCREQSHGLTRDRWRHAARSARSAAHGRCDAR